MKQQTSIRLFTSFIFLLFTGCPDNGVVPPDRPSFSLSVEEVVSTEALMKIEYALSDSITVSLKRNGQTIANNLRMSKEFVFNDTLLQPKQNYTYIAIKIENGQAVDSTAPLQITTMDTTESNFTWETFTFGNGSSSVINDVAIINDTLIYAVGEIYILDSTGQDETIYNAAKWDGKKWELITLKWNCRLYYPNCGPDLMLFSPATAVFTFAPNDVWIASGSIHHFDGTKWTEEAGIEGVGNANKIWGDPSIGLWFVGWGGFIAHRSPNGIWQKLESRTTFTIGDIFGVAQQNSSASEVFCAATSNTIELQGTKLLKISSGNKIDSLPWNSPWYSYSVWTENGKTLYLCGSRLLKYRNGNIEETDFGIFTARIRGNANNDMMVAGDFGFVSHYNGNIWQTYPELYHSSTAYRSLDVKGNIVAAIGFRNNQGIITIGKRN